MKTKVIFSTVALYFFLKKQVDFLKAFEYITINCKNKKLFFSYCENSLDVESNGDFQIEYDTKVFIRLLKVIEQLPESPVTITFDERRSSLWIEAIVG